MELITSIFPSLITLAVGDDNFFNCSKDFSVLYSCTKPKIPFITIIIRIVIASALSPIKPDITVATISIQIIKSLNCDKNIFIGDTFFLLCNSFSPYSFSLSSISLVDSPLYSLALTFFPPYNFFIYS